MTLGSFSKSLRNADPLRRVPRTVGLQPFYSRLHSLSLAGLNLDGAGAGVEDSSEQVSLIYIARHPFFADTTPVVFDVGANVGQYSQRAVELLGDRMVLHAFEPSPAAFAELSKKLGRVPKVQLHRMALGDAAGQATLFADRPGSDIGSLFKGGFEHWDVEIEPRETIEVVRLEDICRELGVSHIGLLKLDVEGGEFAALCGAESLIENAAIDLIQFEFGVAAMGARTFFRDLYGLLNPRYRVHRIVRNGLSPIDHYDPGRCEIFTTSSNYLAVSRRLQLPLRVDAIGSPKRRARSRSV